MTFRLHSELELHQLVESGLSSTTPPGPTSSNSTDWVAWHFTKLAFLPAIVQSGALLCDRHAKPAEVIASPGIKEDRLSIPIDLPGHPKCMVGDHVPFYFAPRSPTSFWVLHNTCKADELVFLGVHVGTVASQLQWCATDGSAAKPQLSNFTRDANAIGDHVDLEVLTLRYWQDKTGEDTDRRRRRHAELLVYDRVPLEVVSHVACYSSEALAVAAASMQGVSGSRKYGVDPNMFAI